MKQKLNNRIKIEITCWNYNWICIELQINIKNRKNNIEKNDNLLVVFGVLCLNLIQK